jgi:hypothetical protein
MRLLLPLLIVLPAPALAHLGHVGAVAGHDHWVAGAAIGAAVAVGVWGWMKSRKEAEEEAEAEADEAEPEKQEA